jgi:NRAMP (natural resistance-associated macrophage protein)-like metal ion transporter
MADQQQSNTEGIEPGMTVETTKGDLGETDISKPKVAKVVKNARGKAREVVVKKGIIFKKTLDIPADRIQEVEQDAADEQNPGEVKIEVGKQEAEELTAVGEEELKPENQGDVLEQVEHKIPTAEGLRKKEAYAQLACNDEDEQTRAEPAKQPNLVFRVLGPGFLAGMAGNDSSAVTSYSVDGASNGFGHLWLLLLSTPLYHSVQYACAKLGRVTHKGLSEIVREQYGLRFAIPAALILIVANIAMIAADLVAIGTGIELITKVSWVWFVIPAGAILWYITVYRNFETIKKIFIAISLIFVVYIVTAIVSGANWGSVLLHTFVPQVDFTFASISSAVALLGATISPYTIFWQVQEEKEQKRAGPMRQQMHESARDIAIGVIGGNLIAFFIVISTAATLFAHHQSITTAADAAKALEPLLGPYAGYLFAVGFIGAGVVAIPVLLASTSYAVAGTFGWPAGLSKKPWQSEGFYLILTCGTLVGIIVALLRFDPIQLMFWANVLNGVLAPVLVVYLLMIGNSRKVMRDQRLGIPTNIALVITILVMSAAAILLFIGLATGQSG